MAMFKRWFGESCSTSNTSIDTVAAAAEAETSTTTNEMAGNSNSITTTTGNSNTTYGSRSYSMTERSHTCSTNKPETEITVADQIEMKKVKIKKKRSFYSLRLRNEKKSKSRHEMSTNENDRLNIDFLNAQDPDSSEHLEIDQEVEIVVLSEEQKDMLKTTWKILCSELGSTLCYGDTDHSGPVVKTFLRLFEEYPQSQEFFSDFRGTPLEALKDDHKLSTILQEHAIRVLRVVEKVIGRIEDLEKSKNYLLKLGQFHRHVGVPSDYLGVMGSIFVHAVKPYLENHNQWNEKIEDAWMELFSHIARVMRHGHIHYFSEPTGRELTSTQSVSL